MKLLVKPAIISSIILTFSIITGNGCRCHCLDVLPFSDYFGIEAGINNKELKGFDYLEMKVKPTSNIHLAVEPEYSFSLMNRAYACKCSFIGYKGNKYSITELNVYTNKDFNDTIKANSELNSLIKIEASQYSIVNGYGNKTLLSDTLLGQLKVPIQLVFADDDYSEKDGVIILRLMEKPLFLNECFEFTIEVKKSNGTVLITKSGNIKWK